ncbi:Metallo-dependent phosphatase [Xylariaceae sp. FL0255]|nr:Metallo-dependent phosphatase [Xylariaceae sp. FL0255]
MPDKKAKPKPPPNESITYSSGAHSAAPDLRFVHYNDVYHVDASSSEPVGGAARFMSLMDHYRSIKDQPDLITLFSGDAFNPSLESSVTKGSHMIPLLNNIGTDAAALGNHDLDFGVLKFKHLASKCEFPWLVANILDPALGADVPIGNCKKTHTITSSNGIKVGLIGLGEREWLATINSLPPNLIYKSATETAKELIPQLRAQGAEIIIAVTHMREPNDNKLAEQTDGLIDIILGGHDHYYNHSVIKGTHVLRSGTDFKQLSYIEARRKSGNSGRWNIDITRRDVTSEIPIHEPTAALVEKLTTSLKTTLQKPIGYTAAPLDARFSTVRLKESNIGNLVCDIMRYYYSGDCTLMASGTIRGDQIYPPGPILLKDIFNCFPFEDPVVVIKVTGQALWDALENSLSQYPALEGRFPQVSNINFEFDARKPANSRIIKAAVGGEAIDMSRVYTLVTRGYMARGKDGYDSLLAKSEGGQAEEIVSEENGILISMLLRQYFMSLRVMGKVGTTHTHHEPCPPSPISPVMASRRQTSIRERRASLLKPADTDETDSEDENDVEGDAGGDGAPDGCEGQGEQIERRGSKADVVESLDRELNIMRQVFRKWTRIAGVKCKVCDSLREGEFEVDWTRAIAPKVEGRIVCVGGEHQVN